MTQATITRQQILDFLKPLSEPIYRSYLNYFRLLETPIALTMLEAESGMRVLDIGSNFIAIPPLWLAGERQCEVVAVDKQPYRRDLQAHVEGIKEQLGIPPERLKMLTCDVCRLPFADNVFDRVSAVSILEHLEPFADAVAMRELGRVLKVGGRLCLTVPFNLDGHVEHENSRGEGYEQRHYSEFTLRERLIEPSGLRFAGAIAFGEKDAEVGRKILAMELTERQNFAEQAAQHLSDYWYEFYRLPPADRFIIDRRLLPDRDLHPIGCGVIAVALVKTEQARVADPARYDPLQSYFANEKLVRNAGNSPYWLTIDRVRTLNSAAEETSLFRSGETCRVAIDFTGFGPVENPVFRVLFHDGAGKVIRGAEVVLAGNPPGVLTGKHALGVLFHGLNLAGGQYSMTVGAWDRPAPDPLPPAVYDLHLYRYPVNVIGGAPGGDDSTDSPFHIDLD